jgi:hypothetical protein
VLEVVVPLRRIIESVDIQHDDLRKLGFHFLDYITDFSESLLAGPASPGDGEILPQVGRSIDSCDSVGISPQEAATLRIGLINIGEELRRLNVEESGLDRAVNVMHAIQPQYHSLLLRRSSESLLSCILYVDQVLAANLNRLGDVMPVARRVENDRSLSRWRDKLANLRVDAASLHSEIAGADSGDTVAGGALAGIGVASFSKVRSWRAAINERMRRIYSKMVACLKSDAFIYVGLSVIAGTFVAWITHLCGWA